MWSAMLDEEIGLSLDGEGPVCAEVGGVVDGVGRKRWSRSSGSFSSSSGGNEHGRLPLFSHARWVRGGPGQLWGSEVICGRGCSLACDRRAVALRALERGTLGEVADGRDAGGSGLQAGGDAARR